MTILDADDKSQPPAYIDLPPSAPAAIPSTASTTPTPQSLSDAEWQAKLKKLEKRIRKYNWGAGHGSDEATIVAAMRDLAKSHPDPEVQAYWAHRADAFESAPESDKTAILKDVAQAVGVLVAAPLLIAGVVLVGTGKLLKAGGNLLTGTTGKTRATGRKPLIDPTL